MKEKLTPGQKSVRKTTISTNLHTKRLDRGLGHEIGKTEIFFLRISLAVVFDHAKARVVIIFCRTFIY